MAAVIAKYDVACCLMHNKSNTEYQNFLIDMLAETQECVNLARQAGIKDEKIMLDPGIGFGKTFEMNLEAITWSFFRIWDFRFSLVHPANP